MQSGIDYTGVVVHQHGIGRQHLRQLAEYKVADVAVGFAVQQAAGRPVGQRVQGYAFLRQGVIIVGYIDLLWCHKCLK